MTKRNGAWKVVAAIGGIVITAGAVVYGYGALNQRVNYVESHVPQITDNAKAVVGMQKDIQHIKQGVERIEKKLDAN